MIYDIIHGYQPFTKKLMKPWVKKNIDLVFLPTSSSMKKGMIKRNVQLQGWTIDEWKKNDIGQEVIENLKTAFLKDNITIGCSLYNHALAPLLSEELIKALIYIDFITVKQIGNPTFFFAPELAVSKKVLRVVFENFPDLIPIIPCSSIGSNKSEIISIAYKGKKYLAYVANIHLKDTLMNGSVYQNINYLPKNLPFKHAQLSMRDSLYFSETINKLDRGNTHVIARDWENGESKDALIGDDGSKEISGFLQKRNDFYLLNKRRTRRIIKLENLIPSSWEPIATKSNPYPYWKPIKRNKVTTGWLGLISIYEEAFKSLLEENSIMDLVDILKETSPALISCIPWHFLSRTEWNIDNNLAIGMLEKIVKPKLLKIVEYAYPKEKHIKYLVKINEYSHMMVIK